MKEIIEELQSRLAKTENRVDAVLNNNSCGVREEILILQNQEKIMKALVYLLENTRAKGLKSGLFGPG